MRWCFFLIFFNIKNRREHNYEPKVPGIFSPFFPPSLLYLSIFLPGSFPLGFSPLALCHPGLFYTGLFLPCYFFHQVCFPLVVSTPAVSSQVISPLFVSPPVFSTGQELRVMRSAPLIQSTESSQKVYIDDIYIKNQQS